MTDNNNDITSANNNNNMNDAYRMGVNNAYRWECRGKVLFENEWFNLSVCFNRKSFPKKYFLKK